MQTVNPESRNSETHKGRCKAPEAIQLQDAECGRRAATGGGAQGHREMRNARINEKAKPAWNDRQADGAGLLKPAKAKSSLLKPNFFDQGQGQSWTCMDHYGRSWKRDGRRLQRECLARTSLDFGRARWRRGNAGRMSGKAKSWSNVTLFSFVTAVNADRD